ncbi:hypothetical protein [Paraclostridium sordellii]|uniref:hypothetical protein n=1 Tax=Paraclostridium sordellii TaxID=1505 RepID=UPI002ED120B1
MKSKFCNKRFSKRNNSKYNDLIYPLFVVEGENIKEEIPSLPDVYHFSLDKLEDEIKS